MSRPNVPGGSFSDAALPENTTLRDYILDVIEGGGTSGLAAWTQIAAQTVAAPTAVVSFLNIPATYSDLLLVYDGLGHNYTTTTTAPLLYPSSNNGVNYPPTGVALSPAITDTATVKGHCIVRGYGDFLRRTLPRFETSYQPSTAAAAPVAATTTQAAYHLPDTLNALKVTVSNGSLDAGTFTLYGR